MSTPSINSIYYSTRNNNDRFSPEDHQIAKELRALTLPLSVKTIISDYIPTIEMSSLLADNSPYAQFFKSRVNFINLTDPKVVKFYFAHYFKSKQELVKFIAVAKRVYECSSRPIAGTQWGFALPMDSEVLAQAMEMAQDQIVVEMAGASGENSILLGFSSAREVYMNDVDKDEMIAFQKLKEQLPKRVSEKLFGIQGDCLEILNKNPDLANRVGLILNRNLIHFFNDKQLANYLSLLKKMLMPGGHAVIIANSKYAAGNMHEEFPDATKFVQTVCFVDDYIAKQSSPIFECSLICEGDFENRNSSLFVQKGTTWIRNEQVFKRLNPFVQNHIEYAWFNNGASIQAGVKKGGIRLLESFVRRYSKKNLKDLFESNGFKVTDTFVINRKGHLVNDEDLYTEGAQVGVIIQAPVKQTS